MSMTPIFGTCVRPARRAAQGISEIATVLRSDQVISYSRGCIVLLDRAGLEKQSCECYRDIKDEFERLLPAQIFETSAPITLQSIRKPVEIQRWNSAVDLYFSL
jgi:hypothetical protein